MTLESEFSWRQDRLATLRLADIVLSDASRVARGKTFEFRSQDQAAVAPSFHLDKAVEHVQNYSRHRRRHVSCRWRLNQRTPLRAIKSRSLGKRHLPHLLLQPVLIHIPLSLCLYRHRRSARTLAPVDPRGILQYGFPGPVSDTLVTPSHLSSFQSLYSQSSLGCGTFHTSIIAAEQCFTAT